MTFVDRLPTVDPKRASQEILLRVDILLIPAYCCEDLTILYHCGWLDSKCTASLVPIRRNYGWTFSQHFRLIIQRSGMLKNLKHAELFGAYHTEKSMAYLQMRSWQLLCGLIRSFMVLLLVSGGITSRAVSPYSPVTLLAKRPSCATSLLRFTLQLSPPWDRLTPYYES